MFGTFCLATSIFIFVVATVIGFQGFWIFLFIRKIEFRRR